MIFSNDFLKASNIAETSKFLEPAMFLANVTICCTLKFSVFDTILLFYFLFKKVSQCLLTFLLKR